MRFFLVLKTDLEGKMMLLPLDTLIAYHEALVFVNSKFIFFLDVLLTERSQKKIMQKISNFDLHY